MSYAALAFVLLAVGEARQQAGPLKNETHSQRPTTLPKSTAAVKPTPPAYAYLVNGFRGCCIPKQVRTFLLSRGAVVHESNWNEINREGDPGGDIDPRDGRIVGAKPYTDEVFIGQMRQAIAGIPASVPLVLIGHSFGGDSVLQVVKRINGRKITVLAVLDGVGKGGLRENTTRPVPSNVETFFNTWQENPPFMADPYPIPFDRLLSGELTSQALHSTQRKQNTEKTSKCETKYRDVMKTIPQLLGHGEVPNDACIQQKIIDLLIERIPW